MNGSVIEVSKQGVPEALLSTRPVAVVETDDRRPSPDERYFAFVHDGNCINDAEKAYLKVQFTPTPLPPL